MLPSDERFDADDLSGPERDLRLKVHDEAIVVERRLQRRQRHLEREARGLAAPAHCSP